MANDVKNRLYVNSNEICLNHTRNQYFSGSPVRGQNRLFVVRPLDAVSLDYGRGDSRYVLPEWLDDLLSDTREPQNVWISVSWIQRIKDSDIAWTDWPRWNWKSRTRRLLTSYVKGEGRRQRILNMIEQWIHKEFD